MSEMISNATYEISRFFRVETGGNGGLLLLGVKLLLLLTAALFVYFTLKYLRDYQIGKYLWSIITDNMSAYDKIQKAQMQQQAEDMEFITLKREEEKNFIDKFYDVLASAGIADVIPGFSETGFVIIVASIGLIILVTLSYLRGALIGIAGLGFFFVVVWYLLTLAAYNRKVQLEGQLLQFINACASASAQYSNLIDIFGAIYPQFKGALKKGLEACYIEAKQTNDKEMAIKHLTRKFRSEQFTFLVDNLELCSSITGDYHSVAKDLSNIISIYMGSFKKKQAALKSAKMNVTLMFGMSFVILYCLGLFLGDISDMLFHTTIGNLGLMAMVLVYFYGLNMKAE